MGKTKNALRILLLLLITAVGIYLGSAVSPELLHSFLITWGAWAPLGYIALFAVLPAFFFPVAVLALAGGLLFGLWWGSIYTFSGAMLNCMLMFFLARYGFREKVEQLVQKKLSPEWNKKLKNLEGKTGFLLLIVLRLIPAVPYNLINYAFGLTSIPLRNYMLASAVGIIPGTLAFINIGDKALDPASPDFWIALGLLGLLLTVTAILGKKCFPENEKNGDEP